MSLVELLMDSFLKLGRITIHSLCPAVCPSQSFEHDIPSAKYRRLFVRLLSKCFVRLPSGPPGNFGDTSCYFRSIVLWWCCSVIVYCFPWQIHTALRRRFCPRLPCHKNRRGRFCDHYSTTTKSGWRRIAVIAWWGRVNVWRWFLLPLSQQPGRRVGSTSIVRLASVHWVTAKPWDGARGLRDG